MAGRFCLPARFATGCHRRSRRYVISPGAVLLTLFCRADALADLSDAGAASFTDIWFAADSLFKVWQHGESTGNQAASDPLAVAQAMLDCVAPVHLPPLDNASNPISVQRLHKALAALMEGEVPAVAAQLGVSERSLQRLFMLHWGITPKLVQRLLRLQRCIRLWDAEPDSLADLAIRAGLVDQAHLAREFRQLVGYPPSCLKSGHKKAIVIDQQEATLWALRMGGELLELLIQQ